MRKIPLTQGKFALVDEADFDWANQWKWCAQQTQPGRFYAVRTVNGKNQKKLYLHCEMLGQKGIDHKNGNGLDCCRDNLRPATHKQNLRGFQRKSPGKTSRFRGVTWHKTSLKWQAQIQMNQKCFYLGLFEDERRAARAYDHAAKEKGFFEEALNFPL